MPGTLIGYHADCPDGYGSMWWLKKNIHELFGSEPDVLECRYGDPFNAATFRDKHVYLVDFCYKREQLIAIADECMTLTVFDHHASSAREIEGLDKMGWSLFENMLDFIALEQLGGVNRCAVVMQPGMYKDGKLVGARSGVGLTGEYLRLKYGIPEPWFFQYLEDRDLWTKKFPETEFIASYAMSSAFTEVWFDSMWGEDIDTCMIEARGIVRSRRKSVAQIAASAYLTNICGYEVWCCACPYEFGSDVAGVLYERDKSRGFAAYYVDLDGVLKFGLRSGPEGKDVSLIAGQFNIGGGHPGAAGFEIIRPNIVVPTPVLGYPEWQGAPQ